MIDDWILSLIYAAWLAGSTLPLGLMLGSSCSPCCPQGCGVADGKPRTDPANEGTWVPAGTWRGVGGVTWTFTANPGDDSGETWFFYGSASTSRVGGGATTAQQQDWYNICNWYSNKTTSPSTSTGFPSAFDKRATRLPPQGAVVHIYTSVTTTSQGPATVKQAYFWPFSNVDQQHLSGSELIATNAAHDSAFGVIFAATTNNEGTVRGGATFVFSFAENLGTVDDGASFLDGADNFGTVNDGATFLGNQSSNLSGAVVNGGASFSEADSFVNANGNDGTINGGAVFGTFSRNTTFAVVNDSATFNGSSTNAGQVNDGAFFNGTSTNDGTVNDSAEFNDDSSNGNVGVVNGGGVFNDNARNLLNATVNGGAIFNDAACSTRRSGTFSPSPCTRIFRAHPTDLPTCNGTAPNGCNNSADTCGCG